MDLKDLQTTVETRLDGINQSLSAEIKQNNADLKAVFEQRLAQCQPILRDSASRDAPCRKVRSRRPSRLTTGPRNGRIGSKRSKAVDIGPKSYL